MKFPLLKTFQIHFARRLFLCAVLLIPLCSKAEGWTFPDNSSGWGEFVRGFATGYGAHELGHIIVARSKGYTVSHDSMSLTYPNAPYTDASHLQVASAGLQTQWLMAELAFRDHHGNAQKEVPGNFAAGVISAQLGITLAYLTVLKNHPQGDVAGIAQATGYSNDRIVLALAVPGMLDAWRLFGNQVPEWVPQLSLLSKGVGIGWVWTY